LIDLAILRYVSHIWYLLKGALVANGG